MRPLLILVLAAGTVCAETSRQVLQIVPGNIPSVVVGTGEKPVYVHRFPKPVQVHAASLNQTSDLLLIWYEERPPRHLTIIDLKTQTPLCDFAPGFGGDLLWTEGDVILHRWGCGTNCISFAGYDRNGKKLFRGSATGVELTPFGYFITFPSLPAAGQKVVVHQVPSNREITVAENLPFLPQDITATATRITLTSDDRSVTVDVPSKAER